jgi:metal-dependent HD superfamily phosphatase/phosphodiesterase
MDTLPAPHAPRPVTVSVGAMLHDLEEQMHEAMHQGFSRLQLQIWTAMVNTVRQTLASHDSVPTGRRHGAQGDLR